MSISKLCADCLRVSHLAQTGQRLGASHARELVAAFFGYKSHAALLAESKFVLSDIEDASVMVPDVPRIQNRLGRLNGLPSNMLSAMDMARALSDYLVSEDWFGGQVWLYESLGNYIVEEYLRENDFYISDELSGEMATTNAYFEAFPCSIRRQSSKTWKMCKSLQAARFRVAKTLTDPIRDMKSDLASR